jgi:hypothetical protein
MQINFIPTTASEDLTHRAAERTRKKIYSKNIDRYILQYCTAAVLLNCINECRICQKHSMNNNTVIVWAVTTKKGVGSIK